MPTIFTHALTAAALAGVSAPSAGRWKLILLCGLVSVIPDLDVISFYLGIPYAHMLGHRGLSHSLFCAFVVALVVMEIFFRVDPPATLRWWRRFILLFLSVVSHGALDALTDGGLGVAFLAPFSNERFFFPFWRPVKVSPIGMNSFFSERGAAVMMSEVKHIWIPVLLCTLGGLGLRLLLFLRSRKTLKTD